MTADETHDDEPSVNEDEMKQLLEQWESPEGAGESDSDDDDESVQERVVDIPSHVVDHVVLACGDLDAGIQEFETITGCSAIVTETSPAYTVKGLGIRCARVCFDTSYLEIIAPNDASPGPIGALIQEEGITKLTLFHYAIRYDLNKVEEFATTSNYVTDRIMLFGGNTKAGEPRKWDVVFLHGKSNTLGGMCPFFIHWRQPEFHPCTYLALNGSSWGNLAVTAPTDDPLHSMMDHIGSIEGMTVKTGAPNITFSFTSPEGPVTFSASSAVGFKFPGLEEFDDDMPTTGKHLDFEAPEAPEMMEVPNALPPAIEPSM